MPTVYTPGTIKVAINYQLNGQPVANVIHVRKNPVSAVTAADVQDAATTVSNWVVASLQAQQSSGMLLLNVTATDVSQAGGPQFITVTGTPEYGAQTGEVLPNNVAFVISFRTGLSGRSFRGRVYNAGLTADQVNGNQVTTAVADAFVGIYEQLAVDLADHDLEHVVLSTIADGVPRATGLATPITSYIYVDLVVDTQRKRLH